MIPVLFTVLVGVGVGVGVRARGTGWIVSIVAGLLAYVVAETVLRLFFRSIA